MSDTRRASALIAGARAVSSIRLFKPDRYGNKLTAFLDGRFFTGKFALRSVTAGLSCREMTLGEVDVVINYFHQSPLGHLKMMGVDPTKLPEPAEWLQRYTDDYAEPIEKRKAFLVIWESDGATVGFSTADKIVYAQEAYMHLHVLRPEQRNCGIGAACVRESARIYFEALKLKQLFCQPNAFNVAPHRTLQKAGFRYVKTFETVPGPLNYRQAVTRWVLDTPTNGIGGNSQDAFRRS